MDVLSSRTLVRVTDLARSRAFYEGVLGLHVYREYGREGVVTGAIQVPPDGRPIVFLADHPVTGGYPVIAVVASSDLGVAAQLRPGDAVRFVR